MKYIRPENLAAVHTHTHTRVIYKLNKKYKHIAV